MPIRFNAGWIIGADDVSCRCLIRQLQCDLALTPAGSIRSADFVVAAGLHQVNKAYLDIVVVSFFCGKEPHGRELGCLHSWATSSSSARA